MITAIKSFYKNYFNFSGRATRSEYWYVYLFNLIIGFVFGILMGIADSFCNDVLLGISGVLFGLYLLFNIIPSFSILWRRLHDVGKSGWWYLICYLLSFLCGIGSIVLIVLLCTDSKPDNQWGPNPKGMSYQNPYAQNPYGGPYQQ